MEAVTLAVRGLEAKFAPSKLVDGDGAEPVVICTISGTVWPKKGGRL